MLIFSKGEITIYLTQYEKKRLQLIRKLQPYTYLFVLIGFVNFLLCYNSLLYAFLIAIFIGLSFYLLLLYELNILKKEIFLRYVEHYFDTIVSVVRKKIPEDMLEIELRRPTKYHRYYLFTFLSTPDIDMINYVNIVMYQYLSKDPNTSVIDGFIVVIRLKKDFTPYHRLYIHLTYLKLRFHSFLKQFKR